MPVYHPTAAQALHGFFTGGPGEAIALLVGLVILIVALAKMGPSAT